MRHYHITRSYLPDRTVGDFRDTNGKSLWKTLERPWKHNAPNVSCIPEGEYIVKRDHTGKHQFYAVQNVPNRTFIEMHTANKPEHLQGCIALGSEFVGFDLFHSTKAMNELVELQREDSFLLVVRSYNPNTDGELCN